MYINPRPISYPEGTVISQKGITHVLGLDTILVACAAFWIRYVNTGLVSVSTAAVITVYLCYPRGAKD